MKKLEAIISPHKLAQVKAVLTSDGVRGLTISEVRGIGHEAGHMERHRGATYFVDWLPKIKLELLAEDDYADYLVRVIRSAAESGRNGAEIFPSSRSRMRFAFGRASAGMRRCN